MKNSVEVSKYDSQYYRERQEFTAYDQLKNPEEFSHIYQKAGSMLKLGENDKVIDLGCGSGQLSFYLYLRYGCAVTGIDYSTDAISLCQKNLNILANRKEYPSIKEKIKFQLSDNASLSDFQGIKAVFLVDVLEHLYDDEIKIVLDKIMSWAGKNGIYLIIHTDNNDYLKFIQPAINWVSLFLGKTTTERIIREKKFDQERHINLTTPAKLRRKLAASGFKVVKKQYPAMGRDILKNHLGPIGEYRFILYPIYFLGKLFYFLRPSFYLLAKYD
jgi:cyclopropane fatty-acyl-phospholipid synthase-like methyltransferase